MIEYSKIRISANAHSSERNYYYTIFGLEPKDDVLDNFVLQNAMPACIVKLSHYELHQDDL